jgi:hypothetical protein
MDCSTLQATAERIVIRILHVIALRIRVGGRPHSLELRTGNRLLVFWQGSLGAAHDAKTQREEGNSGE